jgi:transposase, IS30 family
MPYRHLSLDERFCIASLSWQGLSIRAIATIMGRHFSTISRELARNRSPVWGQYSPVAAQRRAEARQQWSRPCPKSRSTRFLEKIRKGIEAGWSPEQIAGRLRLEHPGDDDWRIPHQTIYAVANGDSALRRKMRRSGKKKRKRYGGPDGRGRLAACRPISERPKKVATRSRVGDWEGDVMRGGKGKAVVVGFLERKTGLFMASKRPDRTAQAMLGAAEEAFSSFPDDLCRTLTLDNGKENSCHAELEKLHGFKVYFADPGCAWQKGCIENTFGLLRQYMPKKANIAGYSVKQLEQFVEALNNRPRKRLGYLTPNEAFKKASCCT